MASISNPTETISPHYAISYEFPCRVVLYLLSWSGFLVSFMMRNDINIAIVAMVKSSQQPIETNSTTVLYCYANNVSLANERLGDLTENIGPDDGLDWPREAQSVVIASFYWSYVISQLVGGIATQKFGTKRVFGYAQLFTALSSLGIPFAASLHYGCVIALRSVQGFASGLTWPAMYAIVHYWIPIPERSRFMSSFQGFSIGIGITYPLCGIIIAWYGWRAVFFTTGSIGLMWCLFWYLLAFDTPEQHPRISVPEKRYILEHRSMNTSITESGHVKVPWKSIFMSLPAWSIGVTTFGRIWVSYTFITHGPMYMKDILGFNITKNGILNGAPFISSYFSAVIFCYIADKLYHRKILTLTTIRKIFTALAQVVPGLLVLIIGWLECDIILVLIVWFIAVSFITAAYAGAMANIVDIAPNFAGPVLAFAQTIHMTASFLSPLAAGYLVFEEQTLATYKHVFYLSAVISIITYIPYQIWGTGEVQSWNEGNIKNRSSI